MNLEIPRFDKNEVEKVECKTFVYRTVNEKKLLAAVCFPTAEPSGCVMFIHGGGWRADSSERLLPHAKYAALCGALGVSIDYRLIDETTDVRDGLEDCCAALDFIRKLSIKRYGRELPVTAIGDSAGGYYAACLGCTRILDRTYKGPRVDFVVDLNGIVDLTGKWSYGLVAKASTENLKKVATEYSPLRQVSQEDAPVLILHGNKDRTVDLSDSEKYRVALDEKGVKSELKILDGAAHAFILFDYRHDNAYVAEILTWVMRCLREKQRI